MITILIGAGLLIQRFYGITKINNFSFTLSFWVGFALILGVGQVWNLFLPADGRIWAILLFLAIPGYYWNRTQIGLLISRNLLNWKTFLLLVFIILMVSTEVAFFATNFKPVHDTGSYHLPATLWFNTFPIVPGLSNLHSRLGFNSSLFVFSASMSEGIWENRPFYIMMGPLIIMTYVPALLGIKRSLQSAGKISFFDLFSALLIFPVYYFYHWTNYASSLSPNGVVFLLILIGTLFTLVGFFNNSTSAKFSSYVLFCASLIFAVSITIKLTIAPFAASMWLLTVWWSIKSNFDASNAIFNRKFFWIVASTFLLIIPWLYRGVILSGYPLYPITVAGINVDWKVPEVQAELDAAWTYSYSRKCYEVPPKGFDWVLPWAKNMSGGKDKRYGIVLPALISIVAGLIVLFVIGIRGSPFLIMIDKKILWISLLVFLGIIVWFLTAPDFRFGSGLFWILSCLLMSMTLFILPDFSNEFLKKTLIITLSGILLLGDANKILYKIPKNRYKRLLTWSLISDRSCNTLLNDGLLKLPEVEMWTFTTASGLQLNVPQEGNQIWDAPLLSSPHPSPSLKLRNPKRISKGFKSVGEWKPYGYPILKYKWHDYAEKRIEAAYNNE